MVRVQSFTTALYSALYQEGIITLKFKVLFCLKQLVKRGKLKFEIWSLTDFPAKTQTASRERTRPKGALPSRSGKK